MILSNCEMVKIALLPLSAENFEKYYVKPVGDPLLLAHSKRMRKVRNALYISSALFVASFTTAIFCYEYKSSSAPSNQITMLFYYFFAISTGLSAVFLMSTVPILYSQAKVVRQRANSADLIRLEAIRMRVRPSIQEELVPDDPLLQS